MRLSRPVILTALGFLLAAPALAQTAAPSPTAKQPAATTAPPSPSTAPTTQSSAAQVAQQERMAQAGLIDINSASKEQLDGLPQIGSARAEAIIKGRPYKAKRDLVERKIIPENAYKAIQHKIVARQKS